MMASSIPPDTFQNVRNDLSRLTVHQLKYVVRGDGMPVSGTKGLLQERLRTRLDDYYKNNDARGFERMRNLISNAARSSTAALNTFPPPSQPIPLGPSMGGGPSRGTASYAAATSSPYGSVRLNFKQSPFYEIEHPLTAVEQTKVVDSSRGNFEIKLKLSPEVASKFSKDNAPSDHFKVMVFCAAEPVSTYVKLDVAFPSQIELRVNGMEVRANLRGLKNRPGSTMPADITPFLRKSSTYENSISAAYTQASKRYYFVVNLVKQIPVEQLVRKLREGKSISKEQVTREMRDKAQDVELEATSTVLSLKCPLSTLRIQTPCRSSICSHNQCFDALAFLQLQQQGPTWICPVCNKHVAFEALQVDRYVQDILENTPSTVEQISISPNGQWDAVGPNETKPRPGNGNDGSDSEDLIEIPDVAGEKDSSGYYTTAAVARTPPVSSREQSLASGVTRSSSGKRHHSAIIDLTLSSDEEEELAHEPKRIALNPVPPTYQSSFNSSHGSFGPSSLSFSIPHSNSRRPPVTEYGP